MFILFFTIILHRICIHIYVYTYSPSTKCKLSELLYFRNHSFHTTSYNLDCVVKSRGFRLISPKDLYSDSLNLDWSQVNCILEKYHKCVHRFIIFLRKMQENVTVSRPLKPLLSLLMPSPWEPWWGWGPTE